MFDGAAASFPFSGFLLREPYFHEYLLLEKRRYIYARVGETSPPPPFINILSSH
jgi:hypothetical protein